MERGRGHHMLEGLRRALDEACQCFICLEPCQQPQVMHCCGQLVCESCLNAYLLQLNRDEVACPHCRSTSFPPAMSSHVRSIGAIRDLILSQLEHLQPEQGGIEAQEEEVHFEERLERVVQAQEQRQTQVLDRLFLLNGLQERWRGMLSLCTLIQQEWAPKRMRQLEAERVRLAEAAQKEADCFRRLTVRLSESTCNLRQAQEWLNQAEQQQQQQQDLGNLDPLMNLHAPVCHGRRVCFRWRLACDAPNACTTPLLQFGDCHFRLRREEGDWLVLQVLAGPVQPIPLVISASLGSRRLGSLIHEAQRGLGFSWRLNNETDRRLNIENDRRLSIETDRRLSIENDRRLSIENDRRLNIETDRRLSVQEIIPPEIEVRLAYLWQSDELDCVHRLLSSGSDTGFAGWSSLEVDDPAGFVVAHVDGPPPLVGKDYYAQFDQADLFFLINP